MSSLKVGVDSRLQLQFHGAKVSSDVGLFAAREFNRALGMTMRQIEASLVQVSA